MGDNFTGREHDHDVLENEELVTEVINNLNTIATSGVSAAYDKIKEAVTALNNVKGLSEYVGTVSETQLESIFSGEGGVEKSIKALAIAMQQSADSIKEYDESVWYEKAGSTILMGLAKAGEGLLNILEDLGDGVFSVVGFVTNDWFGTGGISNLVKRELSHEPFEGFYNSDLAKKSRFTEDSGLAGGIKIASTTAGYIAIAACSAGVGTGLAGTGGAAATFASSTTIANTVIAGVAGLGSGTETGLREGKGFYEAFATNGLSQAAINGGIAFAAGKYGEHLAKAKAVKAAKAAVEEADDMVNAGIKANKVAAEKLSKAQTQVDDAARALDAIESKSTVNSVKWGKAYDRLQNAKSALSSAKTEKEIAESILQGRIGNAETARQSLAVTKAAKPATFQGYNDKISNKFFEKGKQAGSNWRELGFVKGTKANASGVVKDVAGGVKTVAKTVTKPVFHPVQTFKSAGNAVKNVVVHPVQTAKSIPSGIVNVAKTVNPATTVASVPGLVSSTGTSVYRELRQDSTIDNSMYNVSNATSKNISSYNDQTDINRRINENFGGGQSSNPTPTNSPSNSTPTPTNTGGSTNGGSTSGGNTYSGNTSSGSTSGGSTSGGSPTYQSPVSQSSDTTAQLKKTAEEKVVDPVKEISKTTPETTTPESTTPTDTTYQTPQQESPAAVVTVPSNDGGYYDTTYHTGGGYSGEGFTPADVGDELNSLNTDALNPLDETLQDNSASIDEIVKGSKYTKIPSSSKPITTTTSTGSGSSSVIPIAAGLSAAAAAGIGAKAYMDRKKNNDFNDDEDDDFETEEWSGDDESVNVDYDDSSDTQLDNDDDYSYQAEPEEKYGARSNEELADLQ